MSKFIMHRPLRVWYVTQKFGEVANLDYYKKNGITFVGHNGMDLVVHHGDPVFASHDGIANFQVDDKGGHGVVIRTNDKFDYNGEQVYFKSIYWHLCDSHKEPQYKSPIEGKTDVPVKAGDIIGYADNTGLSTGDHLHFALKPVAKNENNWVWYNVAQDNGYMGAIDPAPYLSTKCAEDVQNYIFTRNMKFGDRSEDVRQLQLRLQKEEFFPLSQECTGYYGLISRNAVLGYQIWKGIKPNYGGFYVGPQTRKILNES